MKKTARIIFLLAGLLFIFPCGVMADEVVDDFSLGDILNMNVESVAFFMMSAKTSPNTVYIVDVPEYTDGAFRTSEDILYMDAPGVITARHSRHGTLVGMRGVLVDNNAKTLFMLDGQQFNQRMHFGYTSGLQTPLMGDMDRMEIIYGPGAIAHGSGAINGFVNYIPKNGTDNPGGFAKFEYGFQEKLYKGETGYGFSYGEDKDLYLYAGVYNAEGYNGNYKEEGYKGAGNPVNPDTIVHGQERPGMRFAAYWNQGGFSWNTFYQEVNPSTNSDYDSRCQYWHSAMFGTRPKYTFRFNETESLEITGALTLMEHGQEVRPDDAIDRGGQELHIEGRTVFRTTRFEDHKIAFGGLYGQREFKPEKQYFQSDYEGAFESVKLAWDEISLFAEDVYTPIEDLTISIGVRYDYEKIDEKEMTLTEKEHDNTSWRLAAAYAFNDDSSIKAAYQQAFRTPDARYYDSLSYYNWLVGRAGLASNVKLEPETMDSYTLTFNQNLFEERVQFEVTGFYNTYEKLLQWGSYEDIAETEVLETIGSFSGFRNDTEDLETWGTEFSARARLFENTDIKASYTFTRRSDDEDDIRRFPRHIAKLNIGQHAFDNKLYMNTTMIYHTGREATGSAQEWISTEDRFQLDFSAKYMLTENLGLKLLLKNVFREEVPPPPNWQPWYGTLGFDERFLYAELSYTF